MSQEFTLTHHSGVSYPAFSSQNVLATAKIILNGIGYQDLQPSIYAAELAEQQKRWPLVQALRFYVDEPENPAYQRQLAAVLPELIIELQAEIAAFKQQQQKYQREAALQVSSTVDSSYLSQAQSWAMGQLKYFFGSTAAQQTDKYTDLIAQRQGVLQETTALLQQLVSAQASATESAESDNEETIRVVTAQLKQALNKDDFKSPASRRLLQTDLTIADRCYPTGVCDLASLMDGYGGFALQGEVASDQSGFSVSSVGDINGDGVPDVVVGAPFAFFEGRRAGKSYVVFGSANMSAWSSDVWDISSVLNGQRGFVLQGEATNDYSGNSVSGAGDINADGIADLIVGTYYAAPEGRNTAGKSYVVFGSANTSAWGNGVLNISSLMNGQRGFVLQGQVLGEQCGYSVSDAGDINGDGVDDLVIGARAASPEGRGSAGKSYVVFGSANTSAWGNGVLNISSLINGQRGFVLYGAANNDLLGSSVSSVGDINGDGVSDLIIGAWGATPEFKNSAGKSYVVFGTRNTSAWGNGILNISSLINGQRGFVLQGEMANDNSGWSVSYAGDINSDGMSDLVVGAYRASPEGRTGAGKSYVIFGSANVSAWGNGVLNISSLINGQRGFVLQGEMASDRNGYSVSQAGDVNGDGVDDLLIGASLAAPGGRSNAGKSYVVFGSANASTWGNGVLNISSLMNGHRGFVLQGEANNDNSGSSVSAAGDINGDGLADIVVGASAASPMGRSNAGKSYVIWGATDNLPPVIINNSLTLHNAEIVILTSSFLASTDDYTPDSALQYSLSNIQHGLFAWVTAPSQALNQFFQGNISAGLIQFSHDGSNQAPGYSVMVSDGQRSRASTAAAIVFYRQPSFVNAYSLAEGASLTVTDSLFSITEDYPDSQVLFQVSNLQHIVFNLNPGPTNISQFSRSQLKAGQVQVQHDGGELAPSYALSLNDPYYSLSPQPSNINFTWINDAPAFIYNRLSILQGSNVTLSLTDLSASDPDNSDEQLRFYISNLQHGNFLARDSITAIYDFLQANISRGEILFLHDDSSFAPTYRVVVSDGSLSTAAQTVAMTFNGVNHPPILLNALLSITEGQSVVLSTNQLSGSDIDTPAEQLIFQIRDLNHGRFERLVFVGTDITQFSQQDIQQNLIRFVHDDSEEAPSFNVVVTDGVTSTTPRAAIITYTPINDAPVLGNNTLMLAEGQTLTLTTSHLSASDRDNLPDSLVFAVSQVEQGRFEIIPGTAMTSFSQQQVSTGQVRFVHNGGEVAPSYQVSVNDGALSTLPQVATIQYTPINDAPRISINQLSVTEGGSSLLTTSQLLIDDPDSPIGQLHITASAIQGGQFEHVFSPGAALTGFSQLDVQSSFIRFVHDGGENPASYAIEVSDGSLTDGPEAAAMQYTPINDPPMLSQNQLSLVEGDRLTLSSQDLAASDPDTAPQSLTFTISQLQHGLFVQHDSQATLQSFSQEQVMAGQVDFVHDSGQAAPSYFVSVSDSQLTTIAQAAIINFTARNDRPILESNILTVDQGRAVLITSSELLASDEETLADDILFLISAMQHGQFEYVGAPGEAVTTFSQSKIRTADIRFVSDGSIHAPSYSVQVSDGELQNNRSTAVVNFNLAPAGAKAASFTTQNLISLLSTLGSVGVTLAGYLWWRNKTAEHRRGHDFANYLRKELNFEYYDFAKGTGEVYKTTMTRFTNHIDSNQNNFYSDLTATEKAAFAVCVGSLINERDLTELSQTTSGLFNWLLCFSIGWSNALKITEFNKQLPAIAATAVAAWKQESKPTERWQFKSRSFSDKWNGFFASDNCCPKTRSRSTAERVMPESKIPAVPLPDIEMDVMSAGPGTALPVFASASGPGLFDRSKLQQVEEQVVIHGRQLQAQGEQLTLIQQQNEAILQSLGAKPSTLS